MKEKEERGRDREANLFQGETSWRIAEITEPGVADAMSGPDFPARIGAHGGLDRERQGLWEGDERDEGGKERAVPIYSTFARADS